MVEDVRLAVNGPSSSDFFAIYPGELPTPDDFEEPILKCLKGE